MHQIRSLADSGLLKLVPLMAVQIEEVSERRQGLFHASPVRLAPLHLRCDPAPIRHGQACV